MTRSKSIFVALAVMALLVAGCSDDSGTTGTTGSVQATVQGTGDATGDAGDDLGSDAEMPEELADFPLPADASIPFPATANDADVDPRETLAVTVNSMMTNEEVVATVGDGLEPAGYEIESENVTDQAAIWEFTKDGLPGNVTVGREDPVVITINLFRSGTR